MTRFELLRNPHFSSRHSASWNQLFKEFDGLFRGFNYMNEATPGRSLGWNTSYDLKETDQEYLLSIDLPGVKRDQIEIEVNDDQLIIAAERGERHQDGDKEPQYKQRNFGRFQKAFTLPKNLNKESIEAHYEDGVLYLALPKQPEKEAQKIKISEGKGSFLSRFTSRKDEKAKEKLA